MTDAAVLRKLADAVEAGEDTKEMRYNLSMAFFDRRAETALTSVDAGLALLKAVLGKGWGASLTVPHGDPALAWVRFGTLRHSFQGRAPTPARALLAAILRAKAEEG